MLRLRAPTLLDRPDQAWFDVELMQKDIGLVLERGRSLATPLPTAATADQLLTAARALGHGKEDIVVAYDVLMQLAGREPVTA
jgi:3-hydroxyisobutyrate dehydrogenase-like beta-hydroxyacid dehydrogenase